MVSVIVDSRRATPGIRGRGGQPHPANRYGGSWVGLTLWTPPEGLCANAGSCRWGRGGMVWGAKIGTIYKSILRRQLTGNV